MNFTVVEAERTNNDIHLYVWIALMLLIFIFGTCGNLCSIISICSTKKLQSHSNVLILNMAVIDLILSGIIYPTKVIVILIHQASPYHIPANFCRYYGFFSVALSFSSTMTNCAVAVNRFIAIVYAQKYYNMQKTPVLLLMVLIPWVIPPAISFLGLMNRFGDDSFHMLKIGLCTFNLELTDEATSAQNWRFILSMSIPGMVIPTFIIAISYAAIYIKVWMVRRNLRRSAYSPILMKENEVSTAQCANAPTVICLRMKRFEHRVRGARMMFICFMSFCVTYWPATIAVLVAKKTNSNILLERPMIMLWFFGLYFTGCCLNPIIYAWMNVDFRRAFKRLLCSCCCCNKDAISKFSPRTLRKQIPSSLALHNGHG